MLLEQTRQTLLSQILSDPNDLTVRRVYCDVLDELGGEENHARAAWYRWSMEQIEQPACVTKVPKENTRAIIGYALVARTDVLGCTYKRVKGDDQPISDYKLINGFCEHVSISLEGFFTCAQRLFSLNPIKTVDFLWQTVHGYPYRELTYTDVPTFRVYISNIECLGASQPLMFPCSFGKFLNAKGIPPYGDRDYATPAEAKEDIIQAAVRWGRWKAGIKT